MTAYEKKLAKEILKRFQDYCTKLHLEGKCKWWSAPKELDVTSLSNPWIAPIVWEALVEARQELDSLKQ